MPDDQVQPEKEPEDKYKKETKETTPSQEEQREIIEAEGEVTGEVISEDTISADAKEPEPEFLQEKQGFGSQFDEFLEELNLSRKHIFYGIGCLILLAILIFGGAYGWSFYKNRKYQKIPQSKPTTEISQEETGVPSSLEIGKVLSVSPEMIGETGILSAISIGSEIEGREGSLAHAIMMFRRMQNAYETNIEELLNKATDRRARLLSHLSLLRKFELDGTKIFEKIKIEINNIQVQYETPRNLQDTSDKNFFEQLDALNALIAENLLEQFIQASREVVSLRARFKALQKVQTFYEKGLPKLSAKIRDIELNQEALISGIKVYDVKGSDLKLILTPHGEAIKQEDRLQSESFPLFPRSQSLGTSSASIPKGKKDFIHDSGGGLKDFLVKPREGSDFITKPGGGF